MSGNKNSGRKKTKKGTDWMIRIPHDLHQKLTDLASKLGKNKNSLARHILYEKCIELENNNNN